MKDWTPSWKSFERNSARTCMSTWWVCDALSGGRFLFGIGAGWNAEELENHGVAFEQRWKVTRECVLAMKKCWTEKAAEYHGAFIDFAPAWVEPKPVQKPHPPILIGASRCRSSAQRRAERSWSSSRSSE